MKWIYSVFVAAASFSAWAGTPPPGTINVPELVERVDKGVVNIQAVTLVHERIANPMYEDFYFQFYGVSRERIRKQPSLGSGFVIDEAGYILTNHHVIDRASEVEVFIDDGSHTKLKAKIIGSDKKNDLALLQVKAGPYLQALRLGNSDPVKVGESVVAIGNPFGLSHTVTAGIISAKNRVIGQGPYDNFLQTDASINPGNSGGPLFNAKGEVIGINTAVSAAGHGLGFAIPINQAKRILPDLKKFGRISRAWLGTLLVTLPKGVFVEGVVIGSASHKAGIKLGDRVLSIDGKKVDEQIEVEKVLEGKRPGETVTIEVQPAQSLMPRTKKFLVELGEEPKTEDELPQGLI
ncbi:MAG TPA: trypsin-like peptidase domain-containing protein [Bdellovibrionota bacterium]|jgi:serine protease Do